MGSHTATAGKMRGLKKGNSEEQGLSLFILSFDLHVESLWDETSRNTDSGEDNDLNYGADSYSW